MHLSGALARLNQRVQRAVDDGRLECELLEALRCRHLDGLLVCELGNAESNAQRLARLAAITDDGQIERIDVKASEEPGRRIPGDEGVT